MSSSTAVASQRWPGGEVAPHRLDQSTVADRIRTAAHETALRGLENRGRFGAAIKDYQFYGENKMGGLSEEHSKRQERLTVFLFHFSWITLISVFALLMRVWLGPPDNLAEDLNAFDEAETDIVSYDFALPPTLQPLTDPLPASPVSNSVHVPLYRSLYVGEHRTLKSLAGTLSIHNTSSEHPLILTNLTYFDGNGEATIERLEAPYVLPPMASAEIFIDHEEADTAPVATAVVGWSGHASITPPLIEAVIIGKYGTKSFSVLSRGVSLP